MANLRARTRRRRHTVATVICHGFIALRCGFGTAAGLRLHFRRVLDTSPLVYRRTFRRIGA